MTSTGENGARVGAPQLPANLPPMVYVPSQRVVEGDAEAQLELRYLVDGRLAAPVYSTLERLVEGCGEDQPWVLLPVRILEQCREELGIEAVVLDATLPLDVETDGDA